MKGKRKTEFPTITNKDFHTQDGSIYKWREDKQC